MSARASDCARCLVGFRLVGFLLAAGLAGCASPPPTPVADPTPAVRPVQVRVQERVVRDLIVVQFGNLAVSPQDVRLQTGERVVWSNHSDYLAQVVFPLTLTESLQCSRFGEEWRQTADHLASVPIEGGRLDLLLPCALAPGSYHYEIYLFESDRSEGDSLAASVNEPELRLTARLLVQ